MFRYTIKMRAQFGDAVAVVTEALERHGYRVIRSFDLASALDADDPACSCPHHGTDRCTCRYTVLLVYTVENGDTAPHAITVHTQNAETFVTVSPLGETVVGGEFGTVEPEYVLLQELVEASQAAPSAHLKGARL